MDIWLSVASDRSIPRSKLLEPKNFSPSKIHYSIYSFKVCLLNFQQKEGRKVLFLPIIFFASGKKLRSKEKKSLRRDKDAFASSFSLQLSASCINPFFVRVDLFQLAFGCYFSKVQSISVCQKKLVLNFSSFHYFFSIALLWAL